MLEIKLTVHAVLTVVGVGELFFARTSPAVGACDASSSAKQSRKI